MVLRSSKSDLRVSHIPNIAWSADTGSIWGFLIFRQCPLTGLNGAVLITFFRIAGIHALNSKRIVLHQGKPACIFPFGRRIVSFRPWEGTRGNSGSMFGSGKTFSGNIPIFPRFSLRLPVPECFPAFIRKKRPRIFEESPDLLPDSLSGIISELKMTAFITNREVKFRLDQPYLLIREKTPGLTNCRAGIALCSWVHDEKDFLEYWADRIFPKKLLEMFVKGYENFFVCSGKGNFLVWIGEIPYSRSLYGGTFRKKL